MIGNFGSEDMMDSDPVAILYGPKIFIETIRSTPF